MHSGQQIGPYDHLWVPCFSALYSCTYSSLHSTPLSFGDDQEMCSFALLYYVDGDQTLKKTQVFISEGSTLHFSNFTVIHHFFKFWIASIGLTFSAFYNCWENLKSSQKNKVKCKLFSLKSSQGIPLMENKIPENIGQVPDEQLKQIEKLPKSQHHHH